MGQFDPSDPVRVVMSAPVVSVTPSTTLAEIGERLADNGIGAATIMDGDQLVGIVSERDVAKALGDGATPDEVWVADVMTSAPMTTEPEEAMLDVATRMLAGHIRHMPVVEAGKVVGIVSERDLLAVLDAAWRREHDEPSDAAWDAWLTPP